MKNIRCSFHSFRPLSPCLPDIAYYNCKNKTNISKNVPYLATSTAIGRITRRRRAGAIIFVSLFIFLVNSHWRVQSHNFFIKMLWGIEGAPGHAVLFLWFQTAKSRFISSTRPPSFPSSPRRLDFTDFCRRFKNRYLFVCPNPFRFGQKVCLLFVIIYDGAHNPMIYLRWTCGYSRSVETYWKIFEWPKPFWFEQKVWLCKFNPTESNRSDENHFE